MNDIQYLRMSDDGINYLDYSEFMKVPCGIVTRNDNLSNGEIDDFIIKFIKANLGKKNNSGDLKLAKLNQKHTNTIIPADSNLINPADGTFTDSADHILTIRTADCFPVFLSDGVRVSLIHAGWRGALAGIVDKFFRNVKNFDIDNCRALIGPGIGSCCFEVSSEVAILSESRYRSRKQGKYYVDIKRLILDEMKKHGVKYIMESDDCTACNIDKFYSYRQEGIKVKQMISFIHVGG